MNDQTNETHRTEHDTVPTIPPIPRALVALEAYAKETLDRVRREKEAAARQREIELLASVKQFHDLACDFVADLVDEQARLRHGATNVVIFAADLAPFINTYDHEYPTGASGTKLRFVLPHHETIQLTVTWDAPNEAGEIELRANSSKWITIGTAYSGDDLGRAMCTAAYLWKRNNPIYIERKYTDGTEWEPLSEAEFRADFTMDMDAEDARDLLQSDASKALAQILAGEPVITGIATYRLDESDI